MSVKGTSDEKRNVSIIMISLGNRLSHIFHQVIIIQIIGNKLSIWLFLSTPLAVTDGLSTSGGENVGRSTGESVQFSEPCIQRIDSLSFHPIFRYLAWMCTTMLGKNLGN